MERGEQREKEREKVAGCSNGATRRGKVGFRKSSFRLSSSLFISDFPTHSRRPLPFAAILKFPKSPLFMGKMFCVHGSNVKYGKSAVLSPPATEISKSEAPGTGRKSRTHNLVNNGQRRKREREGAFPVTLARPPEREGEKQQKPKKGFFHRRSSVDPLPPLSSSP